MLNKILDILMPWLTGVGTFSVWFLKQFGVGLKALFDNLAVLAVIIPLVAGTWAYTKHVDRQVIKERQHTIDLLVNQIKCMKTKGCRLHG